MTSATKAKAPALTAMTVKERMSNDAKAINALVANAGTDASTPADIFAAIGTGTDDIYAAAGKAEFAAGRMAFALFALSKSGTGDNAPSMVLAKGVKTPVLAPASKTDKPKVETLDITLSWADVLDHATGTNRKGVKLHRDYINALRQGIANLGPDVLTAWEEYSDLTDKATNPKSIAFAKARKALVEAENRATRAKALQIKLNAGRRQVERACDVAVALASLSAEGGEYAGATWFLSTDGVGYVLPDGTDKRAATRGQMSLDALKSVANGTRDVPGVVWSEVAARMSTIAGAPEVTPEMARDVIKPQKPKAGASGAVTSGTPTPTPTVDAGASVKAKAGALADQVIRGMAKDEDLTAIIRMMIRIDNFRRTRDPLAAPIVDLIAGERTDIDAGDSPDVDTPDEPLDIQKGDDAPEGDTPTGDAANA
jgi:hypothetical protein